MLRWLRAREDENEHEYEGEGENERDANSTTEGGDDWGAPGVATAICGDDDAASGATTELGRHETRGCDGDGHGHPDSNLALRSSSRSGSGSGSGSVLTSGFGSDSGANSAADGISTSNSPSARDIDEALLSSQKEENG